MLLGREFETSLEWTQYFKDDLESLFYADQRQLLNTGVDVYPDEDGAMTGTFPPAVASSLIGMGTWRLAGTLAPCIEYLVCKIEGAWRELFPTELAMYPEWKWKPKGWDFIDSLDPEQEWDGYAYVDVPDPEKGEPGYPRLLIENRVYCTNAFRKMHIEVARRQDGLHVLHIVMYPRYNYDLPIFAMDVVTGVDGVVSLAVVDSCPVRRNMMLNAGYMEAMEALQALYLPSMSERAVPGWGREIFSEAAVVIRPKNGDEMSGFMKYAVSLHRAHCMLAVMTLPLSADPPLEMNRKEEVMEMHKRFVDYQLQNKKTSRVLDASFGKSFTSEYMSSMLFDYDPDDHFTIKDVSYTAMLEFFNENQPLPSATVEWMEVRKKVDLKEARKVLEHVLGGMQPQLNQRKLEWALETLYKYDPDFQEEVSTQYMNGYAESLMAEGKLGETLAEDLALLNLVAPKWTHE